MHYICQTAGERLRAAVADMKLKEESMELKLTAAQQNFLAELCSLLGSWCYSQDVEPRMAPATLHDRLLELADRFSVSSQDLGVLYDKLHRTGANA